jgi:alpha-galactosidase
MINALSKISLSLQYRHEGVLHTVDMNGDENCSLACHTIENYDAYRHVVRFQTKVPIVLERCMFFLPYDYANHKGIFCNGYQSWSQTELLDNSATLLPIRKGFRFLANNFGDYNFYKYSKKKGILHSWSYSYIKLGDKKIVLLGSLDETQAFTSITHDTSGHVCIIEKHIVGKNVDADCTLLDFFINEDKEYVAFDNYFQLYKNHLPQLPPSPAIGWTSWYKYYTHISEHIITQNVDSFAAQDIPLEYFQIDDGYQHAVGDWLYVNKKFPKGMAFLAEYIHAKGYKAGLWLAPFAVEQKSYIFKEHKDWLLKSPDGKYLKMGFNPLWSGWFYALDFYKHQVRHYLQQVFDTILQTWGYDMVKLDFLYGVAQYPQYGKAAGEVMYDAMQLLRTLVGDKKMLGCGVPLASSYGIAEYCRVGQDIHTAWEHKFLKWIRGRERVSTFLAIQNTIHRRHLDGRFFVNDPDVFILRKKKQSLSQREQFTLLHANLLFGNLIFTSDNISEYAESELHTYRSIFPLVEKINVDVEQHKLLYKVTYQIGERHYISFFNLGDHTLFIDLPRGIYFDKSTKDLIYGNSRIDIPAHGSLLLYSVGYSPFAIIGTDGYFFPAAEIKNIWVDSNSIKYDTMPGILVMPRIFVKVPKEFEISDVNGKEFVRIEKRDFSVIVQK